MAVSAVEYRPLRLPPALPKCPVRSGSGLPSKMSSWLALLLLVTAACLRFGDAEGDPLPAALVELVRNTPISSIEDLQLLLLSDSVDEEPDMSAATGGHRLPRSLDAQPAQQALCKVRTEVVEVTRSMLDRSNANFLLWPPCVEVQRCSGCCNTKSLQCVPVVTHTRYLQVMKIEYINKKPTYAKAVVSVVDHVECRCQPAPRLPPPKKKSTRRQHSGSSRELHHNQTLSSTQVKVHSKDELHQWDELKQNQRSHMDHDLMDQQWSSRGDTFTQRADTYSLPREHSPQAEDTLLHTPLWAHNSSSNQTVLSEANATTEFRDKFVADSNVPNVQDILEESTQTHSPLWHQDKYKLTQSHVSALPQPITPNPETQISHTEANFDRVERRFRPTKEPNPDPPARPRDNETPQKDRILEREEAKLEEERRELLLLHKRLDQEKELLRQQQLKREEEERNGHLHKHHHHHAQTTTHTPKTTTSTTTTQQPSAPAGPRPPAQSRPRRRRKNRKRISKAAMRAMLM